MVTACGLATWVVTNIVGNVAWVSSRSLTSLLFTVHSYIQLASLIYIHIINTGSIACPTTIVNTLLHLYYWHNSPNNWIIKKEKHAVSYQQWNWARGSMSVEVDLKLPSCVLFVYCSSRSLYIKTHIDIIIIAVSIYGCATKRDSCGKITKQVTSGISNLYTPG